MPMHFVEHLCVCNDFVIPMQIAEVLRYILAVDVGVVLVGHGTTGGLDLLRLMSSK